MSDDSRLITINGWLFNGDLVDGVEYEITELTGYGEPAATFTSEQNVGADGAWATTGFRAPRAVGLTGVVRGEDAARTELGFDIVRNLISLDPFPITLHWASGDRTIWVRRDGDVTAQTRELPTEISWSTAAKATDPAIYAGDADGSGNLILSTGLPRSDGGVTFPITFPITFTGASATGDVTATLTAGGKLTMRIDGPVTDPQIVVENAAGLFRLAWSGTIPTGMWLDVDPQKRQALLQGQSSRVPYVRYWPRLAPGLNTIRFRAASYDAGTLTATIRPTL